MAEGEKQFPGEQALPGESEIGKQFSNKLSDITRKVFLLERTDELRSRFPLSFAMRRFAWDSIDLFSKSTHKDYAVPLIDTQTGGIYAATKNSVGELRWRKPEEVERLSERAKSLASFMDQLLTPEEALDSDKTVNSVRLIDFILDEDVIHLWMDLEEESYSNFFQALQDGKLPKCLTSDEEVKRVNEDFQKGLGREFQHMVNVSKGAIMEDILTPQPDKIAARQGLLVLCADKDGKINPTVNVPEAFSILEKEYPL